jgi:hypothetical protein
MGQGPINPTYTISPFWHVVFFASMGLINAYKDMFDNVVSPINSVVINHQNQTRINDL